MVSSILSGKSGAGGLAIDPRLSRAPGAPQPQGGAAHAGGDSVEVSDAASWSATRESVRTGLSFVDETLALARDAQTMLLQVQALTQNGGSQADLDALLKAYADHADGGASATGGLSAGGDIAVTAEPGAPAVRVAGADLCLKQTPVTGDLISIGRNASLDDPDLAALAQRSLDALQGAMERLGDAARSLQAHQGFLGAAEGALAANPDLDADGARLLALQVRQGLANVGAIANVEPQAVLALFKA